MRSINATWFPKDLAPEHRAQLEALASQAEWLSSADLERLVAMMSQLNDIDRAREKEAMEQAAYEEEFRRARAREINEALRNAEMERQIKRARIAAALNIPVSEVNLE